MTTEIIPVNKITHALQEANITEQVLAGLRGHLSLKVNGETDKEGYAIVHKARMQCKDLRVLATKIAKKGREAAVLEQKAWIAEEKRVVGVIEEIETYLESQERIVDEAKERAERERKEAEERAEQERQRLAMEKTQARINALLKVGVSITWQEAASMPDSDFDQLLLSSEKTWKDKQELKRIEDARRAEEDKKRAEEQKKLDEQRKAQEAEQRRIDEEKRKLDVERARQEAADKARKEEQERQEREKKEAEERRECEAKEKARQEAMKPDREKLRGYALALTGVPKPTIVHADCKEIFDEAVQMLERVYEVLTIE